MIHPSKKNRPLLYILALLAALMALPSQADAQRMGHRPPMGSSRSMGSRPAARPAAPSASRPPSAVNRAPAPSTRQKSSSAINGGAVQSSDRYQNVDRSKINSNNVGRTQNADRTAGQGQVQNLSGDRPNASTGDRNANINTGDRNINIDNSRDINVNRNVVVRSPVPYYRPPYAYGGFHFYCHWGYHYHPYHPYYWGPMWHPWGFFVAAMAATAIVVSVNNQQYQYDQGVFYEPSDDGYTVVEAPNGAVVPEIPPGAEQVTIEQNVTNNYYYGGTYYEKGDDGYTVVPPTAGSLVEKLPEGAEEVRMGDVTYVKFGDTYYQPVQVDGKDMYEVVQVEPAE